ncbi:MAG: hypothetical protein C5B52_02065 [Bacteroidetes bacterium]|nr:MAG: hypothetical protein C5B52_02065 [Bacteroidota bacterium]
MRVSTLVIAITLISLQSNAQIQIGGQAGWNYVYASASTKDGTSISTKGGNGFHLGLIVRAPFDNKLYFVPQMVFSHKTYTIQYNNAYGDSVKDTHLALNYIELPVLLEYVTSENKPHLFFQFGPSLSIGINGKQKITSMDGTTQDEKMILNYTHYERFEFNLVGRIGYQFPNKFSVWGGYAYGLGSIVDADKGPVIKPRMITATLAYWFR